MKISLMFSFGNNSSFRIPLMRLIKKATHIPMTASVRKALGVSRVFQSGRLVVLSAAVLAVTIFMIFFYDKIVIRYGINLAILLAACLKRDFILTMYRKVRRKKQK